MSYVETGQKLIEVVELTVSPTRGVPGVQAEKSNNSAVSVQQ